MHHTNKLSEDQQSRLDQINNEICHLIANHYYSENHEMCCVMVDELSKLKNKLLVGVDG